MRFYTNSHKYVCGIDLHTQQMYVCILDQQDNCLIHENLSTKQPERFLTLIEPYRQDLVVACECTFSWYWLADLCLSQGIEFILGHAYYMGAIHGGKVKNDKLDSLKIAKLAKGGNFPLAYVYPPHWRPLRDLLRRRHHLVHLRSEFTAHIQIVNHQFNLPSFAKKLDRANNRVDVPDRFPDHTTQRNIIADLHMLDVFEAEIKQIEHYILRNLKGVDRRLLFRLKTVEGIGDILALTLMLEIQDIRRFDSVQQFCSYGRLVKGQKESAGKTAGKCNPKIGNRYLKWAMSEAAILFMRRSDTAKRYVEKQSRKHGKAKAISILAHKLGRAVYHIWLREDSFDEDFFWRQLNFR